MFLKKLMSCFRKVTYKRHEVVSSQGAEANSVFIVVSGEFAVSRKKTNKMTKKEVAHRKIRVLNEAKKPEHQEPLAETRLKLS
mmetsp:Transcript_11289/g.17101  ORF Transcript_11289/g.17101 Transcript_11289/m.17101 type:complete len:83 (-) Transcript_11289:1972-2220(-)